MKNRIAEYLDAGREQVVAQFGCAVLVRINRTQLELRGGRPGDRTAAKEWISLFMHEAVLSFRD
jgi:hypothetical protein